MASPASGEHDDPIENGNTGKQDQDSKKKRKTTLRGRWKGSSITNRIVAVGTIVAAGSTLAYAIFALLQWVSMSAQLTEIRKGSSDTHELAVQAKNQADRSKDIASAATNAAEEAKRSREMSERAFAETVRQFRQDQRAWIGVERFGVDVAAAGEQGALAVLLKNYGKTPANGTRWYVGYGTKRYGQPLTYLHAPKTAIQHLPDIAPGGDMTFIFRDEKLTLPFVKTVETQGGFLYLYGTIFYEDAFNITRTTDYCVIVDMTIREHYRVCSEHTGIH